MYELLNFSI